MIKRYFVLLLTLVIAGLNCFAQPVFKGGQNALETFITQNIVYPEYSRQNCLGATIKVGFRLDATGRVNSTYVQEGPGIDLDDEAMRIVKMTSGKWEVPAGYDVNSNVVIPITFTPDYARCTNATGASRTAAIAGYRSLEQLQNVITNYYKSKYTGKADTAAEVQIEGLKKQLGYDDGFINDLLDQAGQKFKQGDKDGACKDWNFVHNIGSAKADSFIAKYCK